MRAGRLVLTAVVLLGSPAAVGPAGAADPPKTGFEQRAGASRTTHEEELAFPSAVDAGSPYASVDGIGRTAKDRPIHLVRLGAPAPRTAARGRTEPVELHICTQHGNEPAGREACLIALRDLAFATAHLGSLEAKAMARVIREWQPDISIDHHEYGPGEPILYDDEVLYLWPRNLNVDKQVHDLAVAFSKQVLAPCLTKAGFTSDEYGISALGSTDLQQSAGGGDEGILRNAAGLRHVVGILVESAVTMNLTNGVGAATTAGVQLRRVASQKATIDCTLGYVKTTADALTAATRSAPLRKTEEGRTRSAPVFFAGQDEDTTVLQNGDATVSAEAPCGYDLSAAQLGEVSEILDLHGIAAQRTGSGARVSMAQPAEPVIPLLLDKRATRGETEATPLEQCAAAAAPVAGGGQPDTAAPPQAPRSGHPVDGGVVGAGRPGAADDGGGGRPAPGARLAACAQRLQIPRGGACGGVRAQVLKHPRTGRQPPRTRTRPRMDLRSSCSAIDVSPPTSRTNSSHMPGR